VISANFVVSASLIAFGFTYIGLGTSLSATFLAAMPSLAGLEGAESVRDGFDDLYYYSIGIVDTGEELVILGIIWLIATIVVSVLWLRKVARYSKPVDSSQTT
jgi:hypothetical protein